MDFTNWPVAVMFIFCVLLFAGAVMLAIARWNRGD
jgi:hypothetical protein